MLGEGVVFQMAKDMEDAVEALNDVMAVKYLDCRGLCEPGDYCEFHAKIKAVLDQCRKHLPQ